MPLDTDKQQRILAAATERFARYGFKKTSIDEIARDAGVGKGTVYLLSPSKEDLFYQVVHRELRAWTAEVSPLLDPRQPADQLLVTVTLAAYSYLEQRPLVKELLLGNTDEMLPLWTHHLSDLRAICRQNSEEVIRIGVRQGRFRADLQVEAVGKLLQDLMVATMLFAYRTRTTQAEQAQSAAVCLDLLLNGLNVRPA